VNQQRKAATGTPDEHILNHILTRNAVMLWHAKAAPSHCLKQNWLKKEMIANYRDPGVSCHLNEPSFNT